MSKEPSLEAAFYKINPTYQKTVLSGFDQLN